MKALIALIFCLLSLNNCGYNTYRSEYKLSMNNICAIHSIKYGYKLGDTTFSLYEHFAIHQNGCDSDKYCGETSDGYQCIKRIKKGTSGSGCLFDDDCNSKYCKNGVCYFYPENGQPDNDHKESCKPGLYLGATGKCTYYSSLNGDCTTSDNCDFRYVCGANNKCTQRGTISKGTQISTSTNILSKMKKEGDNTEYEVVSADICSSSYAVQEGTTTKCIAISQVSGCDKNNRCTAVIDGYLDESFTGSMKCVSNNDVSFCPISEGRARALSQYASILNGIDAESKERDEGAFFSPGYGDNNLLKAKIIYEDYANLVSQNIIDPNSLEPIGNKKCIIDFLVGIDYDKNN